MKARIFEVSALFAFLIAAVIGICGFESDCEDIYGKVLRLHVIANSDSFEDQSLKLTVRDAVLEKGKEFFGADKTKEAAEEKIQNKLSILQKEAEKTIKENGFDYPVKVEIGKTRFNTRVYEDFTLPAGEYDAVRVIIGSGEGKNWWCVMFPPLCLPAAEKDVAPEDVFSKNELELVKSNPKFEMRFWILEKLEELKGNNSSIIRGRKSNKKLSPETRIPTKNEQ